jgi:hypothetical protein
VGTSTIISVEVFEIKVLVDFVPNCTLVTVENPVPVMVILAPTRPDIAESAVILGAAPLSPDVGETGARTWIQLPTPIPVGADGTVPVGHVKVCWMTGTYAVKKIAVVEDEVSVKATSWALIALTKHVPDAPLAKLGVSTDPDNKQDV